MEVARADGAFLAREEEREAARWARGCGWACGEDGRE